jgi:serine phosphatase RsbU (regulator of sigma subunit)
MNEFIERKFVIDDYFYYDIILRYQDILGSSLGAINKLQKADSVFNYTLKFAESNRLSSYHLSDIKLNYADVLRKQKRFADAISVLEQVLSFSIDDLNQKAYIFRTLSELFEENGNLPKSILYIKKYSSTKDSLIILQGKENNFKQAAIIGAEFELKRQIEIEKVESERRIKLSEERDRRNRLIIGSVIAGLIVVLIISFYIYKLLITARKQKLIIEIQKSEVDKKSHIIEEKQKEILDSINYAKRIQYTLLAHEHFLKENLPQNFVLFNPKDIVSGDFYWATKMGSKFYLAVCDSTGHGIPGAFMSLLNIGFLSEAINEKGIEKPNEVFDYVRMKLTNTISKEGQKDGFDGILVCFDQKSNTITYAAANNAPIIIAGGQIIEALADRMPVGIGERKENFTLHTLEVKPSDVLYLYTDGYADQFGGPRGKKFKYKQLNELLLAVHTKPIGEQSVELKNAFETWKGDLEQVDDVCVIGIKI